MAGEIKVCEILCCIKRNKKITASFLTQSYRNMDVTVCITHFKAGIRELSYKEDFKFLN